MGHVTVLMKKIVKNKLMKLFSFILLTVLLLSCSPKLRFSRLIDKYPHLITTDTLTIHDTVNITVPKVEHDTVFTERFFEQIKRDTLVIQKERLKIKIYHDTIHDSVFIKGECDTVIVEKIIERKIPIKYYEKTPTWRKMLNQVILWGFILIIIYGIYKIIKFFKNKL